MANMRLDEDAEGYTKMSGLETDVLGTKRERELLLALGECKRKLEEAIAKLPGGELSEGQGLAESIAAYTATAGNGLKEAGLGAVFQQYCEIRSQLAMANMRLVAHVAKRFRERGISYSDLIQEGFCGLLEAIDRFDLTHETKLATYATWWIRQAMQRAVAAGAYPVRLSPRHLRQLAQSQEELELGTFKKGKGSAPASAEMIHRIHAATRPTISLDATIDTDSSFSLLQIMSDPEGDHTDLVDMDETVVKLLDGLRPREQQVLALRFGLGGKSKLSLSQVGKVLAVSKERVRQIQDRALEKLRHLARDNDIANVFAEA